MPLEPEQYILRAYLVFHKFGIICLSEKYLNCSNSYDDDNLEVSRYNLVLSEHPFSNKCGGVSVYFKNNLTLLIISVIYF